MKKPLDPGFSKTHKHMINLNYDSHKKGDSIHSKFLVTTNSNASGTKFAQKPDYLAQNMALKCDSYLDV